MSEAAPPRLHEALFATERMRDVFGDRAHVQAMLDFEAALARAEGDRGIIPVAAAECIAACCRAELVDIARIGGGAAAAGNLAIPFVKELTRVVAEHDREASGYVHWGATSQDVTDTALVLQMRRALDSIEGDLAHLSTALRTLADRERDTWLAGRTWLQQAVPIPFGVKVAGWLSAVQRDRRRLQAARERSLVLQFGGAVGTLASLQDHGLAVASSMAHALGLALPDMPWHAQRDRVAEIATVLGIAVGTLGKMAGDVALMMQTEVGEASEPAAPGRGGSSTMPHKRNPVSAAITLSAAVRVPHLVGTMLSAMVQQHERGLGGWHAEWETLPAIFMLADAALQQMLHVARGLDIDRQRMSDNLEATRGLLAAEGVALALGRTLGKSRAHGLVEDASRTVVETGRHLREVLESMPEVREHLGPDTLARLFDPRSAAGASGHWIDRVIGAASDDMPS